MIKANETVPLRTPVLQVNPNGEIRDVNSDAARFSAHMDDVHELVDNFVPDDSLPAQAHAETARGSAMPSPPSVSLLDARSREPKLDSIAGDALGGQHFHRAPARTDTDATSTVRVQLPATSPGDLSSEVSEARPAMPDARVARDVTQADVAQGKSGAVISATPRNQQVEGATSTEVGAPVVDAAISRDGTVSARVYTASQDAGRTARTAHPAERVAMPAKTTTPAEAAAADVAKATGTPTEPGAPQAQAAPVLTPAQLQARVLKRKALGLDGATADKILKQELADKAIQANKANKTAPLRDLDLLSAQAAAAVTVAVPNVAQPVQQNEAPKAVSASSAAVAASSAKASSAAHQDRVAPIELQAVDAFDQSLMKAATETDFVDSTATAAYEPKATVVREAAPVAAQSEAASIDEVEEVGQVSGDSAVESPDMRGAPPAPVRERREEQIAEAIGAQLQALQTRIELVNIPQLTDVIEKI